jgi:hypothetical protein
VAQASVTSWAPRWQSVTQTTTNRIVKTKNRLHHHPGAGFFVPKFVHILI